SATPVAGTLKFGATGTTEAVIFAGSGFTGTLNVNLVTTGGLTKFGTGALTINTVNPNFSGPVTLDAGTLNLNNTLGDGVLFGGSTVAAGALGSSDIIVNGGTVTLNAFV